MKSRALTAAVFIAAAFFALASTAQAGIVPNIVNPSTRPIVIRSGVAFTLQFSSVQDPAVASEVACQLLIAPVVVGPTKDSPDLQTLTLAGQGQRFTLAPGQKSWTGSQQIRAGETLVAVLVVSENGCPRSSGERWGSASLLRSQTARSLNRMA